VEQKILAFWEFAANLIFLDRDAHPQDELMTQDDFNALVAKSTVQVDFRPINFPMRIQWLQMNGYDVTDAKGADTTLISHPEMWNDPLADVYSQLPQDFIDQRDQLQAQLQTMDEAIQAVTFAPEQIQDIASSALDTVQTALVASVQEIQVAQPAQKLGG